jgi:hypothetical protein
MTQDEQMCFGVGGWAGLYTSSTPKFLRAGHCFRNILTIKCLRVVQMCVSYIGSVHECLIINSFDNYISLREPG